MKKLLAVLAVGLMTTSAFATFSGTSVRMQGINPNLVGIIDDEYSDSLSVNPSDLLSVRGYRVFTNMSNLYGNAIGNDRALNGTTTGGSGSGQFLLGLFGNPAGQFFPSDAQMGLLYNTGSNLTYGFNTLGALGERVVNTTTQGDTNNDGDFADNGDWTQITNQEAKRQTETYGTDYNALVAYKLMDSIKLGINVLYDDADFSGNSSSEESITGSDYKQKTTVGTTNVVTTHNYSLDAKEENINSTIKLQAGGRYKMDDNLDIGGRLELVPTSQERKRSSEAKISIDLSQTAAALNDPITAEVTAVDGSLQTLPGSFGVFSGAVTTNFNWTNSTNWVAFNTSGWSGITGDEVGSAKADGTGIGGSADAHYNLTNSLKLVGRINYTTIPQNITASLSRPYSEVYYSSASVVGGKRLNSENNNTSYNVSGDVTNDTIGITLGGKATLKDNIILGFGITCASGKIETDGNYTMTLRNVTTVDSDNDGNVTNDGVADSQVTLTDTDTGSFVNETKANTVQLPLGLEMRPWKKLAVRLGVTHQIQTTKTTSTSKIVSNGLWASTTESNGATVITYETTGTGKTTGTETTATTETILTAIIKLT